MEQNDSRLSPQGGVNYLVRVLSQVGVWLVELTTDEARQTTNRYLVHVAVLALFVMALSGLPLSGMGALAGPAEAMHAPLRPTNPEAPQTPNPTPPGALPAGVGGLRMHSAFHPGTDVEIIQRQAVPRTDIPERLRQGIITYTVQPGDTTQGIAFLYGLQDTTIMWCNPPIEDMPDYLKIGQQVVIPPIDGVCHTVKDDDTLESIAEKYKVGVEAITEVAYNQLREPKAQGGHLRPIRPGERLIVANGTKPYVPKIVTAYTGSVPEGARGTGLFIWPATGSLTQGYWWGHRAIDIAAYTGAPIYAADGGFVSFAGWTDIGYGYLLVIDHANGYATYYAHLSGFYVSVGDRVDRGDLIATMGSTGNSTGPHLHFEIRLGNMPLNPRLYLP